VKTAAILPAYNEADRIRDVLKAVLHAPSIDEVIVVDDGSTDATAAVARSVRGVRVIRLPQNRGKGAAMAAGAESTDADILVFLDADLIGLAPEHVEALVAPVRLRRVKMAVGRFCGGRRLTDWSQRLVPCISGQRAIRRRVFERIPDLERTRYGVEMAITRFCHHFRVSTESVPFPGVTHPMKEEKLGFWRGLLSRARMYWEIAAIRLNPRAPRMRRSGSRLLRKIAATERLHGRANSPSYWLYRRERAFRKWREALRLR